jgi:hypothetical protein
MRPVSIMPLAAASAHDFQALTFQGEDFVYDVFFRLPISPGVLASC